MLSGCSFHSPAHPQLRRADDGQVADKAKANLGLHHFLDGLQDQHHVVAHNLDISRIVHARSLIGPRCNAGGDDQVVVGQCPASDEADEVVIRGNVIDLGLQQFDCTISISCCGREAPLSTHLTAPRRSRLPKPRSAVGVQP